MGKIVGKIVGRQEPLGQEIFLICLEGPMNKKLHRKKLQIKLYTNHSVMTVGPYMTHRKGQGIFIGEYGKFRQYK